MEHFRRKLKLLIVLQNHALMAVPGGVIFKQPETGRISIM